VTIRTWSIPIIAAAGGLLASRAPVSRQDCNPPHYRWSVKTDTTLAGHPTTAATITEILTRWATPPLGPRDQCAARAGRELDVYVVRGWIRRIERSKDDGDWHMELTVSPTSPPESCIVAEIPLGTLGAVYTLARRQLDSLLAGRRLDKDGDLRTPLAVWITGAAFFDGQHRKATRKRDITDGGHGRCNTSLRALWELHPVYDISARPAARD
jgi:hypothetical protein